MLTHLILHAHLVFHRLRLHLRLHKDQLFRLPEAVPTWSGIDATFLLMCKVQSSVTKINDCLCVHPPYRDMHELPACFLQARLPSVHLVALKPPA